MNPESATDFWRLRKDRVGIHARQISSLIRRNLLSALPWQECHRPVSRPIRACFSFSFFLTVSRFLCFHELFRSFMGRDPTYLPENKCSKINKTSDRSANRWKKKLSYSIKFKYVSRINCVGFKIKNQTYKGSKSCFDSFSLGSKIVEILFQRKAIETLRNRWESFRCGHTSTDGASSHRYRIVANWISIIFTRQFYFVIMERFGKTFYSLRRFSEWLPNVDVRELSKLFIRALATERSIASQNNCNRHS